MFLLYKREEVSGGWEGGGPAIVRGRVQAVFALQERGGEWGVGGWGYSHCERKSSSCFCFTRERR